MTNLIKKLTLSLALGLAVLTFAHANTVTPLVELQENVISDVNGNWLMNQYVITNNSNRKEDDIYAFALTNSVNMSAWTTREGWWGMTLSKDEWNASSSRLEGFCNGGNCSVWNTGLGSSENTDDVYLGSFESLFGSAENHVNIYYVSFGTDIYHGTTSDEFYFSAPPASEYAVFGRNGRVVYQSLNVPEPGSAFLLGIALFGFVGVRRLQSARNSAPKLSK